MGGLARREHVRGAPQLRRDLPARPRRRRGRMAAPHLRRRLRRHPLAGRVRRPGSHRRAQRGLDARVRAWPACRRSSTWSASCSPAARSCTFGTPEQKAQHLAATLRADQRVVPAVQRTRRRQRPRRRCRRGPTRRRPLRRQRAEGVVQRRPLQQLGHPHGPHRSRGAEARGHLVLPVPDGPARRRGPPAEADDRRGRVRRGLLHRRRAARPSTCSVRCTAVGASAWPCSPTSAATSARA